jgi:hypothetical protein
VKYFCLVLFVANLIAASVDAVELQSCSGNECGDLFSGSKKEKNILGVNNVIPRVQSEEIVKSKKPLILKHKVRVSRPEVDRVARTTENIKASLDGEPGNLPKYYVRKSSSPEISGEIKGTLLAPKEVLIGLDSLRVGDRVTIRIEQSITASPGVPTPIRAEILGGQANHSILIGEAKLDRELKRVLVDFSKIRVHPSAEVFELKAQALSQSGEVGLIGEYHSEDGKFFLASVASGFLAAFTDSQINRSQTAIGTYVQEPSLANSAKAGAAGALLQTSNRMTERASLAPEYTTTEAGQVVSAIITEEPTKKF